MCSYDKFRTGLTYRAVYRMLFGRKYRRRRTVLGYWHQLKKEMYARYQEEFQASQACPF